MVCHKSGADHLRYFQPDDAPARYEPPEPKRGPKLSRKERREMELTVAPLFAAGLLDQAAIEWLQGQGVTLDPDAKPRRFDPLSDRNDDMPRSQLAMTSLDAFERPPV